MTTPVESLFFPQEQKQSGKFLNEDELRQIRDNIDYLSNENKKLVDLIQQYHTQFTSLQPQQYQNPLMQPQQTPMQPQQNPMQPQQPLMQPQNLPQQPQNPLMQPQQTPMQPQQNPMQPQQPLMQPQQQQNDFNHEEEDHRVYHESPVQIGNKSVTIIVDTNKMVYLMLFIIIVIIILKK